MAGLSAVTMQNTYRLSSQPAYVGGSSKLQTLSADSTSIEIEGYSDGKSLRLLKLVFFTYKGAGILQTSVDITQRVLATPT